MPNTKQSGSADIMQDSSLVHEVFLPPCKGVMDIFRYGYALIRVSREDSGVWDALTMRLEAS